MNAWEDFSHLKRLNYEPSTSLMPAQITGVFRGYPVNVEVGWTSTFEGGSWPITRFALQLKHRFNGYLELKSRSPTDKRDSQVGEEILDESYFIDASPKDSILHVLNSANFKSRIIEIRPSLLRVRDDNLIMLLDTVEESDKRIKLMMDFICDLAKSVSESKLLE